MNQECDRSFTRSDALTKHMKTVHENEGPVVAHSYVRAPRGSTTANNTPNPDPSGATTSYEGSYSTNQGHNSTPRRLKLVFGSSKASSGPSTPQHVSMNGADAFDDFTPAPETPLSPMTRDEVFPLPVELEFQSEEIGLNRQDLFRLLRRQTHWAMQDGEKLQQLLQALEMERREEWLAKELLVENLLEAEFAGAESGGIFEEDGADSLFGQQLENAWVQKGHVDQLDATATVKEAVLRQLENDSNAAMKLPLAGPRKPWYRSDEFMEVKKQKRTATTIEDGNNKTPEVGANEVIAPIAMTGDNTEDEDELM